MRSEWIKFWSVKSNVALVASAVAIIVLFGVIAVLATTGNVPQPDNAGPPLTFGRGPVDIVMSGAGFAVLLMSVLGVLVGAREYSSGFIRTTIAAVPARLPVLWAKMFVFAIVTLPVLTAATATAFTIGTHLLAQAGETSAAWGDPGVSRAVFGTAANLTGIGIMGVALGVLTRSVAGGLATLIGGVLVLPTILTALLPISWGNVLKYVPSNAGAAFTTVTPNPLTPTLEPAYGALVYSAWIVLSVAAALLFLHKRDV